MMDHFNWYFGLERGIIDLYYFLCERKLTLRKRKRRVPKGILSLRYINNSYLGVLLHPQYLIYILKRKRNLIF